MLPATAVATNLRMTYPQDGPNKANATTVEDGSGTMNVGEG